jgi:hypothetical protein
MTETTAEYQKIRSDVLSHLRRKGYYTQPSVRAYPVTIQVLKDLIAEGLVTENEQYGGSQRLFNSTSLMPSTVVVRNQFTQNLKVGNHCGHSGEFFSKLNERFDEVNSKSFVDVGVVSAVEVKDLPKNLWEKLLGRKSDRAVFITLNNGKVVKTVYNAIYQVTRPEF